VSVSQYASHVAEGLGHLLANRQSCLKFLQMRISTTLPLHGLPFFADSGTEIILFTSCNQPDKEIPTLSMTMAAKRTQMNCEM
jgi:hypothetical protein